MDHTVIEAQARYLIEDRVHPRHRRPSVHDGPRRHRLRNLIRL